MARFTLELSGFGAVDIVGEPNLYGPVRVSYHDTSDMLREVVIPGELLRGEHWDFTIEDHPNGMVAFVPDGESTAPTIPMRLFLELYTWGVRRAALLDVRAHLDTELGA